MQQKEKIVNSHSSGINPTSEMCLVQEEGEIDLMKMFWTVWRWKWFIGGFTLLCTLVAVVVTLFILPVIYTSNIVIQPLDTSSLQMSRVMSLANQLLPATLPQTNDKTQVMMNYLNSRQLEKNIIEKFDLLKRYNKDMWDEKKQKWLTDDPQDMPSLTKMLQRQALKGILFTVRDSDNGLINIAFQDEDPEFAAKVVTWIASELDRYLNEDYMTDAKRNRIFVEKQLENAKNELKYWERKIPAEGLTSNEIAREIQAGVLVYSELKKQFELIKIEEDKQLVAFKILDQPLIPVERSSPERTKICGLTMIISGMFAILLSFILDAFYNNYRQKRLQI